MRGVDKQGWTISEVERLTGLSRRDIQRCCYGGKGGVGIISPKTSSWGRRTYESHDLAALFMVAAYRRRGLTLPQVKEVFDQHGGDTGLRELLDEECERVGDEFAEALGHYIQVKALQASLKEEAHEILADQFREVAAMTLAASSHKRSLDDVLALPGMETLIELWLGPGSYEEL